MFSLALFAEGVLAERFAFAGLNFGTTVQELKHRYLAEAAPAEVRDAVTYGRKVSEHTK